MEEPSWIREVGLGLTLWEGRFENHVDTWLRWTDQAGVPIATGAERAEREHSRAERLVEQIRKLGGEPDA